MSHPFTQGAAFGNQQPRVYIRNAEVAYKPSDNFQVRMQVQQSPYGRYMSPYGTFGGYQRRAVPSGDLFWRN
jgi:hypothetical protein